MKRETILLTNLNCPSCAANLEQALATIKGVRRARVAFATGTLELEYDTALVQPADIERTVNGFGVAVAARL